MISSFWNLCRACPSVPVEKLHSEYRSTFQWHEYVGSRADSGVTHQAVVQQPSQASQAYVFWSGGNSGGRGVEFEPDRRGKRADLTINKSSNGWCLKSTADEIRSHKLHLKTHGKSETISSGEGAGGPRKSLSMGTIRAFESSAPVLTHKQEILINDAVVNETNVTTADSHAVGNKGPDSLEWTDHKNHKENMFGGFEAEKNVDAARPTEKRKEYTSEYKKQFRPFSQYEYVDGKFFRKKNDQEMGNPWYKEVIELRKKAGEYRYRGWGTELVPQHLAEVYHQNVWDQVSRRSSLAALALITTTTRSISKEEKDKENARKSMPKRPLSRPNTATPKHPISDLEKVKGKDPESVHGIKKKSLDGAQASNRVASARAKARSQSAGPGGRSPRKTTRQAILSKDRDVVDVHKSTPRHPRPSSADPSLGFSEPVIKSPPEPTRVKSPEQVILRSPDPVNWTVPLDTTKSFTVTQNIRDAPPSPRFRAGLHGVDGRGGHHQGQLSSTGSTKASSPLSSVSSRSGLAHSNATHGQPTANKSSHLAGQTSSKERSPLQNVSAKRSSIPSGDGVVGEGAKMNGKDSFKTMTTDKSNHPSLNGHDRDKTKEEEVTTKVEKAAVVDMRLKGKQPPGNGPFVRKPDLKSVKPPVLSSSVGSNQTEMKPTGVKAVPGTTLRCLEDPTFMFDLPKSISSTKDASARTNSPPGVKHSSVMGVKKSAPILSSDKPIIPVRGGVRVLEAPLSTVTNVSMPVSSTDKLNFVPPAPVATAKKVGVGASLSTTAPQPSKLPSYRVLDAPDPLDMYDSSAAGGRNRASDVIEKARNRFDKFWGKSKDDEEK